MHAPELLDFLPFKQSIKPETESATGNKFADLGMSSATAMFINLISCQHNSIDCGIHAISKAYDTKVYLSIDNDL